MRQRYFARLRVAAPANQGHIADGVVRRAEGPHGNQSIAGT